MSQIQQFVDAETGKTSYTYLIVNVVKYIQKMKLLIE